MKHVLIRYGLISALILIGINAATLVLFGIPGPDDYAFGEVVGYATIIVALVPVFFGVKYYRDQIADGVLSFWKGTSVGLAIATVPSLAFAVYNLVYVEVIDPEFGEKYMQYSLDTARAEMSAAEFESYAAQLESQSALFTDPLVQTIVMFLTVFLIGAVVSIISAIVLRRSEEARRQPITQG